MAPRIETIGDCTLYLGDCREILPTLGKVDAVVTDPPYGVNFNYESWDDAVLLDWFPVAQSAAPLVAFTPGIANIWSYPKATWVLCWAKPGSTRRNATGGFNSWEPVLIYGKRRIWTDFIYLPDCANHAESGIGHPCPKPIALYSGLIGALTDAGQIAADPFMGSGTTGVACVRLGRKFIGIEIEPKYFDIACRRIADEVARPRLPLDEPAPKQEAML